MLHIDIAFCGRVYFPNTPRYGLSAGVNRKRDIYKTEQTVIYKMLLVSFFGQFRTSHVLNHGYFLTNQIMGQLVLCLKDV